MPPSLGIMENLSSSKMINIGGLQMEKLIATIQGRSGEGLMEFLIMLTQLLFGLATIRSTSSKDLNTGDLIQTSVHPSPRNIPSPSPTGKVFLMM